MKHLTADPDAPLADRLDETVRFLRRRLGDAFPEGWTPRVGLILGSGLGGLADAFERRHAVEYSEIPHFPLAGVAGHAGQLVLGELEGVACAALQGRVHLYEGHAMATVVYPARTLVRLGCSVLVVTNAAGGIAEGTRAGSLMLLRDYLNLMGDNPLAGPNDDRLGPRFPDMTNAYDPRLRAAARRAAERLGVELPEGVYAGVRGPSYESPAEVEMLHRLGASAVGMSTVPETIAARHMGARVLGLSCITNMAAGRSDEELTHEDVTATAKRVEATFTALLRGTLADLRESGEV